ncbi:MAG: dephospho-CoA kinase [Clostridiales bacterium]|nr:dephospho-CoA kinase [Clostridiales bacterium]
MTQNKKLIAITGGIGSGKSSVAKILKDFGYKVFSCDKIYVDLLNQGYFNKEFAKNFGKVFNEDGSLNKKLLAQIVFTDKDKLNLLNNLTHKAIMNEVLIRAIQQNNTCFVEVPLLFESNLQSQFDEVIVVKRNLDARIQSVIERDNLTEKEVKCRISNQFDYENANLSNYKVIINDGNINELINKINALLVKIL